LMGIYVILFVNTDKPFELHPKPYMSLNFLGKSFLFNISLLFHKQNRLENKSYMVWFVLVSCKTAQTRT